MYYKNNFHTSFYDFIEFTYYFKLFIKESDFCHHICKRTFEVFYLKIYRYVTSLCRIQ